MTIALPSTDQIENVDTSPEISRRISNLGDGYRRISASGINNVRDKFSVTYGNMPAAEAETLYATLLATQGVETITWTPPEKGSSQNFYMDSVSKRYTSPLTAQVSISLVEKFL